MDAFRRTGSCRPRGWKSRRSIRLHLIVGLRLLGEASFPGVRSAARAWADEIAANRIGDVLMNNPDERGEPHLWAHVQEGVLVDAGGAAHPVLEIGMGQRRGVERAAAGAA